MRLGSSRSIRRGPARRAPAPQRGSAALACSWIERDLDALLREAIADQRRDWHAACADVDVAFENWSRCGRGRGAAFAAYHEALEREQEASELYRRLFEVRRRYRR